MLARTAIVVIPTLAVAVTALVLLGPGSARPATGIRLRGVPAVGAKVAALRLESLRSLYDIDEVTELDGIEVVATSGGFRIGTWAGATGPDGIAEVRLESPAPLVSPLGVVVTRHGALLAQGSIPLGAVQPATRSDGTLTGTAQGTLAIRVQAARGLLAAPFPEGAPRLEVGDLLDPRLGVRADLELTAPGADLAASGTPAAAPPADGAPLKLTTDSRGVARLTVKPLAHDVALTITAKTGEKTGRWEGTLPVIPGAAWIDPSSDPGRIAVVFPAPRAMGYLSFWTEEGRVAGAVTPLHRDADGFYRAEIDPALPAESKLLYASIAGDPIEQGAGTIAWPLRPAGGTVAPRPLELLLDGMPAAREREGARAWGARRAGLGVVGAAAILEILLLLYRSRASQRHLDAHLASASSEGDVSAADRALILQSGRERPILRALLAVAIVGLGFAIFAALSTFRR